MKEVRVPEDRVGVLIGADGETREEFEDLTECELEISDNLAKVEGDPLEEMTAQQIVKAIGRGFNPDKAFKLLEEGYTLHILDINRFANNSNQRERLKGRVIGRDGETRRHIEKVAEIDLAIYGSTIGFIGKAGNIEIALEAVRMLLKGSSHATAYNYLEKNQQKIKK